MTVSSNVQSIAQSIASLKSSIESWNSSAASALSELNAAKGRGGMSSTAASSFPFDVNAALTTLTQLQSILEGALLEFVSVASKPSSLTASGKPGNYYIDGSAAFYLCVATNTWVKLTQTP